MAETENKIEALEKEVVEASANPQADAPKKNAVAAEPTHLSNEAEDLGTAVTKPTDSNPDATKKVKPVSISILVYPSLCIFLYNKFKSFLFSSLFINIIL